MRVGVAQGRGNTWEAPLDVPEHESGMPPKTRPDLFFRFWYGAAVRNSKENQNGAHVFFLSKGVFSGIFRISETKNSVCVEKIAERVILR